MPRSDSLSSELAEKHLYQAKYDEFSTALDNFITHSGTTCNHAFPLPFCEDKECNNLKSLINSKKITHPRFHDGNLSCFNKVLFLHGIRNTV